MDYFLIDGLALGVMGGYSWIKEEDDTDEALRLWFIGPEVKFYIPITDAILIDAHGSFVFNGVIDTDDDKTNQMHVTLGAGLNFMMTRNLAMCLSADYTRFFDMKRDGESVDDSAMNDLSLSLGFKAFVTFGE